MSTRLKLAHVRASTNNATSVAPIARPVGEGGVSTISRAAGRKANSSRSRDKGRMGNGSIFFSAFMNPTRNRQIFACLADDQVESWMWPISHYSQLFCAVQAIKK